ncbi:MAG: ATP-binding protein [Oscillospiraceae bacterium]
MKQKIIKNNLIACLVAITLTAIVCFLTYVYAFESTMNAQARAQCYLLQEICRDSDDVENTLKGLRGTLQGRTTLVDGQGKVLFDSDYEEYAMGNHLARKEIADALANGAGSDKRYSATEGKMNYYYALRLEGVGAIRVGIHSNTLITQALLPHMPLIIASIGGVLIFVIWISTITTKRIVSTIEHYSFEESDPNVYDELSPFINRINYQNKVIATQSEKNRAEKDKLESVFFNMKEGLIVCDRVKTVVQTNLEAQKVFSIAKGDSFSGVLRNAELNRSLQKALDGVTDHGIFQHNGRSYQYTVSPNLQGEENTGAVLLALDVTEQAENQKLRREFTANVTHELKTPLTSILGYSQLITSGIAKPEDIGGFAGIIEKNAQQLLGLIEDIMEISSLEESKGESLDTQEVFFTGVIKEMVKDMEPSINQKGLKVKVNLEKVTLHAHAKHMGDIARNLISNAIKYNKQGGSVDIVLKKAEGKVIFSVSDTGIGIPKSDINKIFERFYVVDKSRNKTVSSTGLGLSIVKHIAISMGGTVEVASVQGKGSTFTVVLPENNKAL